MLRHTDQSVLIQRQYYTDTAAQYDVMHAQEGDDDPTILKWMRTWLRLVEAQSVLDVGAGTGRGIRHLIDNMPGLVVRGLEPVEARIEQAVHTKGIPEGVIVQGVGESMPFEDSSFDVVYACAMLHHVPRPDAVIREMLRVASKAVIIADGNRFGQGSWPIRLLKLALYKVRLWGIADHLKTGGKGYILSEGDGVQYSYSIYDSLDRIAEWADQLIVIPTAPRNATTLAYPLLTASSVMVCAFKESGIDDCE